MRGKLLTMENTHRKLGGRRWVVWSKVNGCCTHDPMWLCDGMAWLDGDSPLEKGGAVLLKW